MDNPSRTNAPLKKALKNILFKLKLSKPFGGYPLHKDEKISPFFIIGSGRCGTTLMRRILITHPDICIPPETFVLSQCISLYQRYNNTNWKDLVYLILSTLEYHPKFVAFEISLRPLARKLIDVPEQNRSLAFILDSFYHFYAKEKNVTCKMWGDKTPKNTFHLNAIQTVFPNAKYIHLIRHGADVVHSYLKTGLHQGLAHSANRWKDSVNAAKVFGAQHPSSYLEVRYELFVQNPQLTIQQVCDFLDIKYIQGMIEQSLAITDKMGDVPKFDHFSSVLEPVSTKNIGKGKNTFSNEEINELRQIIGKELEELGYSI